MKLFNRKNERGQILIESIVSISIASVALIGILSILSNAVAAGRGISERFTATYLAAEGIEVVKGIIDINYAQGLAWNADLSTGSYELSYDTVQSATSGLDSERISSDLFVTSTLPLHYSVTLGLYSYVSSGALTRFYRTVQVTNVDADELQIVSIVEWEPRPGKTDSMSVEDHFFNWRP